MSHLHPHWHSTESEPTIQAIEEHAAVSAGKSISRLPAAVIGITFAVMVAITASGAWEGLFTLGQSAPVVSSEAADIGAVTGFTMTESSIVPPLLAVSPGDTITITNNDTIPHILESKSLRDEAGQPLYTPAIFPGDSYTFAVYAQEAVGEYRLTSTTADRVATIAVTLGLAGENNDGPFGSLQGVPLPSGQGKMDIKGTGGGSQGAGVFSGMAGSPVASTSSKSSAPVVAAKSSSNAALVAASSSSAAAFTTTDPLATGAEWSMGNGIEPTNLFPAAALPVSAGPKSGTFPGTTTSTSNTWGALTGSENVLPTNPFTVDTAPHDSAGDAPVHVDVPVQTEQTHVEAQAKTNLHKGADLRMFQNTRSGPEVWIAGAVSAVALFWVTRRHFKALI